LTDLHPHTLTFRQPAHPAALERLCMDENILPTTITAFEEDYKLNKSTKNTKAGKFNGGQYPAFAVDHRWPVAPTSAQFKSKGVVKPHGDTLMLVPRGRPG
jgi:hypothetical protein